MTSKEGRHGLGMKEGRRKETEEGNEIAGNAV